MSVAKEIQKAGESWKDAMERAKVVLKERREQVVEQKKSELEKLLALVRTKKELQGFTKSDLRRDMVRTAKPRGARFVTKEGNTSNKYGTFPNKLGRKYWETRDRHADRLAPNYPKNMPLLASGGAFNDAPFIVQVFKTKLRFDNELGTSSKEDFPSFAKAKEYAIDKIDEGNYYAYIMNNSGNLWGVDSKGIEQFADGGMMDNMSIHNSTNFFNTPVYAKGGSTQGYDDREDERLAMKYGKIANKDLDSTHSRRDDARFEERGKMANGGSVNMDKHVWEGWTVGDFIEELEPTFNQIMSGRSWQKPFKTKDEVKAWAMDNQPYYKKNIPEVVNYFWAKAQSKDNYADGGTMWTKEMVENEISHYKNLLRNIDKYPNYNKKNVEKIIAEYEEKLAKNEFVYGGMTDLTIQNVSFAKGGSLDVVKGAIKVGVFSKEDLKTGVFEKALAEKSEETGLTNIDLKTIVKGDKIFIELYLIPNEEAKKRFKIKKWYTKTYPTDELGEELDENNTFEDIWTALHNGTDVYEVMGVGDSLIRERVFDETSKIYGVDYEYVYKKWLDSDNYAKGGGVSSKSTFRANNSPLLEYANFKDGSHINLIRFNPLKRDGTQYKSGYKFVVSVQEFKKEQQILSFKTLEKAKEKFDTLVETAKSYKELLNEGKTSNYANGGSLPFMTDPNFGNFQNTGAFADGGETDGYTLNHTVEFTTSDDDSYLRGNIGGDMMDLIEVKNIGDNKYSAIAKSYSVAFEGLKGQELEDEVYNQINEMFATNDDIEVDLESVKIVGKFELGGAFMMTDLAGHTGGSDGLGNPMPLSGVSGTYYTGLVGETGAMSSGELFENGGEVKIVSNGKYYLVPKNKLSQFEQENPEIIQVSDRVWSRMTANKHYTKYEAGGVMAQNQQVINDASQSYVNYYLGEGASQGIYKDGGSIPNNYEGRTPEDVWNNLSRPQRSHFLYDHIFEIEAYKNIERLPSSEIIKAYNSEWSSLDKDIKNRFTNHTREGQYAKGGSLGKALYVAYSSYFDSNKYDEEKIMSALKSIGAKNIHLENDGGMSNQPEVVVFNGNKRQAEDALNEAFDTDYILIYEKNWRTKKMADGGFTPDVSDGTQFMSGVYAKGGGIQKLRDEMQDLEEEIKYVMSDNSFSKSEKDKYISELKNDIAHKKEKIRTYYQDNEEYENGGFTPDVSDGTQFMSGVYANGGKTKSRKDRNRELGILSMEVSEIWDKIGAKSGREIRLDEKLLKAYAEGAEEVMQKNKVKKGSFDQKDYDYLENENDHLFNDFLVFNGYFNPEVTKTQKEWRIELYEEDIREKGKSAYVSNPDIITISGKTSSSTTSSSKLKKYIDNADINFVVLKIKGKTVTISGSDVLNGANLLEDGGDLTKIAFYVPKRDVVEVILKNGETIKPVNGYWVKKGYEPITRTSSTPKAPAKGKVTSPNYPNVNFNHKVVINGKTINLALAKSYVTGLNGSRQYDFIDVDGNPMTGYGFSVKEALKQVEDFGNNPMYYSQTTNTPAKTDETKAHFKMDVSGGGKFEVFVDSNFVNQSQGNLPNTELKHYGYGDFYLQTPDGNIDFIRTSEEKEGFVGRTHKMKGSDELVLKLVNAMKEKGKFESTQTFADGGSVSEDIAECKKLVSAFCKEFGDKFGLDEEAILEKVKFQDYLGHGASVFISLSITSNVEDLKVGETRPTFGYIKLASDINPNGVTGKDDIARTYDIDIEIKGIKRYTQRRTEEGRYFKSYSYGRTVEEAIEKTDTKIIYELYPLEKKDDLKFKMGSLFADGGFMNDVYAKGGATKTFEYVPYKFIYRELDDEDAEQVIFTPEEAEEFIQDWNRDMETDYEDWQDFNKGEEYRELEAIMIKQRKFADGGFMNDVYADGGDLEEDYDDVFVKIYNKYNDKNYFGLKEQTSNALRNWQNALDNGDKNAEKYTKEDVIRIVKENNIDDSYNGTYLRLKRAIRTSDTRVLKSLVRYDQKFTKELYEAITGNKLPNTNKEIQVYFDSNYADGGFMNDVYAKGGEIADIQKMKKALITKAKSRGLYENFGQKEVRVLEDKYGYTNNVRDFDNWAMNFDLSQMAYGGGVAFKPYGKTKGKFKITYLDGGEKQSEIRETLEMAIDTANRYKKYDEFSKIEVFDESGKKIMADGGFMNNVYAKGGGIEWDKDSDSIRAEMGEFKIMITPQTQRGYYDVNVKANNKTIGNEYDVYGIDNAKNKAYEIISNSNKFADGGDMKNVGIQITKYFDRKKGKWIMLNDYVKTIPYSIYTDEASFTSGITGILERDGYPVLASEWKFQVVEPQYADGGMFEDNEGFMRADNNFNYRYPEMEVYVETFDEPIDLTSNVSTKTNQVVIKPLDENIDLNDDKRVRATMGYTPKNRNPESFAKINPRAFEFIEELPMPTSNTHKND